MSITREEMANLQELMNIIESSLADAERIIQNADAGLYERWRAYGKAVTSEFVSMGPSLPEVVEQLAKDVDEEDEEEDEKDDKMNIEITKINLEKATVHISENEIGKVIGKLDAFAFHIPDEDGWYIVKDQENIHKSAKDIISLLGPSIMS